MWKLLPPRTKWKTEHFQCFFMRGEVAGLGRGKWGKIGGLCFGFGEPFYMLLVCFGMATFSLSLLSIMFAWCSLEAMVQCCWCLFGYSAFLWFFSEKFHGTHSHNFATRSNAEFWVNVMREAESKRKIDSEHIRAHEPLFRCVDVMNKLSVRFSLFT